LRQVQIIDSELNWIARDTHLVSVGDLLDRGPDSRKVMDLLIRLQQEAPVDGGYVHVLMGNHELMNLSGDLRYVSQAEFVAFANEEPPGEREEALNKFTAENYPTDSGEAIPAKDTIKAEFETRYPPGYFGLVAAFRPDGKYGAWLLQRPLIIVINDTVYTHGGLPPLVAGLGLEKTNHRLREDLIGYLENFADDLSPENEPDSDLFDDDGPLWYRGTALCHPLLESAVTKAALAKLGAKRVVVGHTPTPSHQVTMRLDDHVVLLDTGMLGSYYKGVPSALVLENDSVSIVYAKQPATQTAPDLEKLLLEKPVAMSDGNIPVLQDAPENTQFAFIEGKRQSAKEIAAYRIDQLLGLGLVPVTVARTINGQSGALSYRDEQMLTEQERLTRQIAAPNWCAAGNSYELMYVLDALLGNEKRSLGNILYFGSDLSLQLTDFADAFGTSTKLPAYLAQVNVSIAPALIDRLAALDEDSIVSAVGDKLSKRQIRAMLKRRDRIVSGWPPDEYMDKASGSVFNQ
ncbi:MAG: metallophosphoesterase, partial [Gammaproteobacteria bacterium]|nr:metallophosphoesterase [Gammaproteobacteria bacterium]